MGNPEYLGGKMVPGQNLTEKRIHVHEDLQTGGACSRGVAICLDLPEGSSLEVVKTTDELMQLGPEWNALQAEHAPAHTVFQTHKWCAAWFERYGAGNPHIKLNTIVGRENGRVVMIWPMMIVRHGPVSVMKWLTDPYAQYGDIVAAPSAFRLAWLEAAWKAITNSDIDGISLRYVREGSIAHRFLSQKHVKTADNNAAPFLDLTPYSDVDAYSSALSRNQRSQRSKLGKRLSKTGNVSFAVYRSGTELKAAIDSGLALKRRWLKEQAFKADILTEPGFEGFLSDLAYEQPSGMNVAAGVLSRNDEVLSVDIGLHYKNEYFGYLLVQDVELLEQSPIKVHLDLLQKWTVERGFTRFDLMIPNDGYKAHWASGEVKVDDFVLATNLWGAAYCNGYLGWLRPKLKRIYHAMPASLRQAVVGRSSNSQSKPPRT